jgi:beta-lactamase regulating signal transducer with metallopeptidase domain
MHQLPALLAQVTAILALALLGARLAAGTRAALRHLLLAGAFGAVLFLPFATLVSPKITIEIATLPARNAVPVASLPRTAAASAIPTLPAGPQRSSAGIVPAVVIAAPPATRVVAIPVATWLVLAWAVVALIALLPVARELWQMRGIRRRSQAWPEGQAQLDRLAQSATRRRPSLLLHPGIPAPISGGLLHPVIALPTDATQWNAAHLAGALLHELEHLRRRDWAVHLTSRAVCALYWFHPLAWLAWRRLRLEAERACDDAVLAREDAAVYAEQLLQLARRMAGKPALPGLQMSGNSSLSSRIRSVLDHRQQRGRAGTTAMVWVVIAAVIVVAALASLRATGPAPSAVAAQSLPAADTAAAAPQPPRTDAPIRTGDFSPPSDTPIRFSDVRNTGGEDPHAYGPTVELCRENGRWTGFYAEYMGPPADPPSGRLENLQLDESSGAMSFATQLTTGVEWTASGEVPARRRYEFSGRLDGNALAGKLAEKPAGPGSFKPASEDVVLKRETAASVAGMSCAKWSEIWNRRTEARNAKRTRQVPAVTDSGAASPQQVVADILDLVQSALADDSSVSLDELTYPITGLRHIQRYAQAVVRDDGGHPEDLAANYIEIINALTNTANMATNLGRRPREPRQSSPGFEQLSAAMHARAGQLAALLMPESAIRSTVAATAERHAAFSVLDLVQATYRDPRFVGPPGGSWLRTELNTLSRAAQSLVGSDGAAAAAATMQLYLLRSAIHSTTRQANDIASRPNHPAEARRKASDLATSLRDIESRLDLQTRPARSAPAADAGTGWLVTLRSVGPLPIGTPIDEVRRIIGDPSAFLVQALHQDRSLPREPDDVGCAYLVTARVPEQIGLMFQRGRLARADVWNAGVRTTSGTQVGDTETQVRDQNGSTIKVTSHRHAPAGAHYMTFTPTANTDREYQMLFETDGKVVTQYRTGLRAAVQQMQGCK